MAGQMGAKPRPGFGLATIKLVLMTVSFPLVLLCGLCFVCTSVALNQNATQKDNTVPAGKLTIGQMAYEYDFSETTSESELTTKKTEPTTTKVNPLPGKDDLTVKQVRQPPTNASRTVKAEPVAQPKVDLTRYHFPYWPKYPANPLFQMCRIEDFTIGKRLGRGGFGQVYLATHKNGRKVALKVISAASIKARPKHVENEETIHMLLNHRYIGKLLCTMKNEQHDVFFALEYLEGGNMTHQLSELYPLSRDLIAKYVAQLVLALRYLHTRCIVHRDVKSENVLFDRDDNIKLIDMGLSMFDCDNVISNKAGTPEYFSPEVAGGRKYGRSTDYYSLAVLTYLLTMQKLPYRIHNAQRLPSRIRKRNKDRFLDQLASGKMQIPSTGDYSTDEVISTLGAFDPDERFTKVFVNFSSFKNLHFFAHVDWDYYEHLASIN